MKRGRESKFKVGDVVWCELDGEYVSYRHVMHPGKVEEVIEDGETFKYKIHLTLFERKFKSSFDVFCEYKIFHPEVMIPFGDDLKKGSAFWFKVDKRKVDGQLVDGGEVFLKGIVQEITKNQVECLFDPCEVRERWETTYIPRDNVFRNSEVGNDLFY